MPRVHKLSNPEIYQRMFEFKRICNRAVQKAQQRNRELGIPNVYSFNGVIYHENEKGELVKGDPFNEVT